MYPTCYLEESRISCGVKQLFEFMVHKSPEDTFEQFCYLYDDAMDGDDKAPFGAIMFSDIVGNEGDAFGKFLARTFPKNPPTSITCKNPNTDNSIITYTWKVPWSFRRTKRYKDALKAAIIKVEDDKRRTAEWRKAYNASPSISW